MNKHKNKPKVICVLGMHRSGTSMLMRILNLCGVYIGEKNELLDANSYNSKGYWENFEIYSINEEILRLLGGSWDRPPEIPSNWLNLPEIIELKVRAMKFIDRMNKESLIWGFKEPRTCLTLQFWQLLIPNMIYIIPFRDPIEVALSLNKRDEFEKSKGLHLWMEYWSSIIKYTQNEKRIFVSMRDIINYIDNTINTILNFIDDGNLDFESSKSEILKFIDYSLVHHRSDNNGLKNINLIFDNDNLYRLIIDSFYNIGRELFKDLEITNRKIDELISMNNNRIREKENEISIANETIRSKENEIKNKDKEILDWEEKFKKINNQALKSRENIKNKEEYINKILNSWSWRLTFIFRRAFDLLIQLYHLLKRILPLKYRLLIGNLYFRIRDKFYLKFILYPNRKNIHDDLISVIIPVYDRTDVLRQSIDSILNQTYQNFELVIVTDGSPEETMRILKQYDDNKKIRMFHYCNNTGNAVRGRNKGIKEARGEYVAFQDSDDIAEPDRLEQSIKYIKEHKVDVVYGGWRAILDGSRNDTGLNDRQEILSPDCNYDTLLKCCVPCQSTVMVRKKALDDVGGLKPKMKYREDHELWLRLAYFGYKFKSIQFVLTNLRLHKGNNELNFKKEDKKWEALMLEIHKTKCRLSPKIIYIIPGTSISGGIVVILQHLNRLQNRGYDVAMISQDNHTEINWFPNQKVTIIPLKYMGVSKYSYLFHNIDILVATHWSTFRNVISIPSLKKYYFVQSDERDFEEDKSYKALVESTYKKNSIKVTYLTMAKWIQKWLKEEFGHEAHYIPNGLDRDMFYPSKLKKLGNHKVRVLLEGPIDIPFKGMKEAFEVVDDIDCEVWVVSTLGKPKKNWKYDKFFESVPINKMREIYSACDVLLKMSNVESFSYPPLEMMSCGGTAIIKRVRGIDVYAKNSNNCFVVASVNEAKERLKELIKDVNLMNKMKKNALITAKDFSWEKSIDVLEKIIMDEFKVSDNKDFQTFA